MTKPIMLPHQDQTQGGLTEPQLQRLTKSSAQHTQPPVTEIANAPKRPRGRPKGTKNKPKDPNLPPTTRKAKVQKPRNNSPRAKTSKKVTFEFSGIDMYNPRNMFALSLASSSFAQQPIFKQPQPQRIGLSKSQRIARTSLSSTSTIPQSSTFPTPQNQSVPLSQTHNHTNNMQQSFEFNNQTRLCNEHEIENARIPKSNVREVSEEKTKLRFKANHPLPVQWDFYCPKCNNPGLLNEFDNFLNSQLPKSQPHNQPQSMPQSYYHQLQFQHSQQYIRPLHYQHPRFIHPRIQSHHHHHNHHYPLLPIHQSHRMPLVPLFNPSHPTLQQFTTNIQPNPFINQLASYHAMYFPLTVDQCIQLGPLLVYLLQYMSKEQFMAANKLNEEQMGVVLSAAKDIERQCSAFDAKWNATSDIRGEPPPNYGYNLQLVHPSQPYASYSLSSSLSSSLVSSSSSSSPAQTESSTLSSPPQALSSPSSSPPPSPSQSSSNRTFVDNRPQCVSVASPPPPVENIPGIVKKCKRNQIIANTLNESNHKPNDRFSLLNIQPMEELKSQNPNTRRDTVIRSALGQQPKQPSVDHLMTMPNIPTTFPNLASNAGPMRGNLDFLEKGHLFASEQIAKLLDEQAKNARAVDAQVKSLSCPGQSAFPSNPPPSRSVVNETVAQAVPGSDNAPIDLSQPKLCALNRGTPYHIANKSENTLQRDTTQFVFQQIRKQSDKDYGELVTANPVTKPKRKGTSRRPVHKNAHRFMDQAALFVCQMPQHSRMLSAHQSNANSVSNPELVHENPPASPIGLAAFESSDFVQTSTMQLMNGLSLYQSIVQEPRIPLEMLAPLPQIAPKLPSETNFPLAQIPDQAHQKSSLVPIEPVVSLTPKEILTRTSSLVQKHVVNHPNISEIPTEPKLASKLATTTQSPTEQTQPITPLQCETNQIDTPTQPKQAETPKQTQDTEQENTSNSAGSPAKSVTQKILSEPTVVTQSNPSDRHAHSCPPKKRRISDIPTIVETKIINQVQAMVDSVKTNSPTHLFVPEETNVSDDVETPLVSPLASTIESVIPSSPIQLSIPSSTIQSPVPSSTIQSPITASPINSPLPPSPPAANSSPQSSTTSKNSQQSVVFIGEVTSCLSSDSSNQSTTTLQSGSSRSSSSSSTDSVQFVAELYKMQEQNEHQAALHKDKTDNYLVTSNGENDENEFNNAIPSTSCESTGLEESKVQTDSGSNKESNHESDDKYGHDNDEAMEEIIEEEDDPTPAALQNENASSKVTELRRSNRLRIPKSNDDDFLNFTPEKFKRTPIEDILQSAYPGNLGVNLVEWEEYEVLDICGKYLDEDGETWYLAVYDDKDWYCQVFLIDNTDKCKELVNTFERFQHENHVETCDIAEQIKKVQSLVGQIENAEKSKLYRTFEKRFLNTKATAAERKKRNSHWYRVNLVAYRCFLDEYLKHEKELKKKSMKMPQIENDSVTDWENAANGRELSIFSYRRIVYFTGERDNSYDPAGESGWSTLDEFFKKMEKGEKSRQRKIQLAMQKAMKKKSTRVE